MFRRDVSTLYRILGDIVKLAVIGELADIDRLQQTLARRTQRIMGREHRHIDHRCILIGLDLGQPLDRIAGLDNDAAAALTYGRPCVTAGLGPVAVRPSSKDG